jgi:hypothetical protein
MNAENSTISNSSAPTSSGASSVFAYFGHHKSASTYINQIVVEVCRNLGLQHRIEYLPQKLAFDYHHKEPHKTRVTELLQSLLTADYDFLCHGNADEFLLETLEQRGYLGFHVIRDPRDIVVSGYFSHKNSHPARADFNPWLLDHRETLIQLEQEEGLLKELEFCETYFERLAKWDYSNPKIFETKFEILTQSPKEEFTKIFEFLGIDVSGNSLPCVLDFCLNKVLHKIAKKPIPKSFSLPEFAFNRALGLHAFEKHSKGRKKGVEDTQSHFRKGVAGDWVNHFTPKVKESFKDRFGGLVSKLGYEENEDW